MTLCKFDGKCDVNYIFFYCYYPYCQNGVSALALINLNETWNITISFLINLLRMVTRNCKSQWGATRQLLLGTLVGISDHRWTLRVKKITCKLIRLRTQFQLFSLILTIIWMTIFTNFPYRPNIFSWKIIIHVTRK